MCGVDITLYQRTGNCMLYVNDVTVLKIKKAICCVIVNDDQQDATILAYLFVPNQLYMFRTMSSPIIRST